MRDVRAQFFLTFAVLGTVLPYAPVFFREVGLSQTQVGLAFALWSGAQVLSPVLVAWAADSRVDPRRLVLLCLAGSGASLLALGLARGVWPVLAVWAAYCLSSIPLLPLLDGIYFSLRKRHEERTDADDERADGADERGGGTDLRGVGLPPYHRVRVWGTIGFIVPSLLLYGLLHAGMPVAGALMSGAALAVLAAAQALLLDDPRSAAAGDPADDDGAASPAGDAASSADDCAARPARPGPGLPTAAAARALLAPNLLVFCAAVFLAQMASTAMAAFYPVYLTERVGIAVEWVGLIAQVGVVVEVFFVWGFGWLAGRLGVKGVLVAGLACVAARLLLLAGFATAPVAVGSQLFHGIHVLMMGVLPQTFLDRHAADDCRHSIQGVFVMLMGIGKMAGSLAAGPIAAHSLQAVFGYGAGLCAAAAVLAAVAFRETGHDARPITRPTPATSPDADLTPSGRCRLPVSTDRDGGDAA
jgi:PPP family 3-phenylpropionic acid transporter